MSRRTTVMRSLARGALAAAIVAVASGAHARPAPPVAAGQPAASQPPAAPGIRVGDGLRIVPRVQYRLRGLWHGGRDFAPGGSYDAISHRARVGAEVRLLSWLRFRFDLQDVRLFGEETDPRGDFRADGLDVHQAWFQLTAPTGTYVRAGRQEIAFDDHRIIGTSNWSDPARSFDAVMLGQTVSGWGEAKLFYAKIHEADAFRSETDAAGNTTVLAGAAEDHDLAVLWARLTRLEELRPSLLAIYQSQRVQDLRRFTAGVFVDGDLWPGLSYMAEAYGQVGVRQREGSERDIRALLAAANIGYRAPLPAAPGVMLWVAYLSGDEDPQGGTDRDFDTLFASNHRHYGYMDFFLNIPRDTERRGLLDIGARLKLEPLSFLTGWVDWHHFRLAEEHPSGAITIGNEIDVVLDGTFTRYFGVQAVFAVFVPGAAGTALKGNDDTELYGYLQTNLKF